MSRRRQRLLVGLMLGLGAVALMAFGFPGSSDRAPAELAGSQWQRLRRQFTRLAEVEAAPPRSSEVVARWPPPLAPCALVRPWLDHRDRGELERQAGEYGARRAKGILELQQFRRTYETRIEGPAGRQGGARLVNLNPRINFWYLLQLSWDDAAAPTSYHLTNSQPASTALALDPDFTGGLTLESGGARSRCDLWSSDDTTGLAAASLLPAPYVTLCDDRVTLRRPTAGRRTRLEWATDFLRDNIWEGEALTVLVRDHLYRDAHLETGELIAADALAPAAGEGRALRPGQPVPAQIDLWHAADLLAPSGLGLALAAPQERLQVGQWYAAAGNPGAFVSLLRPGLVDRRLLAGLPLAGGALDEVEAQALTYLVAFDLARYEMGFAVGTDHPRVDWSERARQDQRDDSLPGPDGIGELAPLVAGGIVPYSLAQRTVATFTAGFKRSHGAFRTGPLAAVNAGSHYGFIESGVVLSKLQPGLATIFGLDDGEVQLKTWTRDDDALLERVAYARQNGVPIVEAGLPGPLVNRWGDGNWSGSEDKKLRSVRAGICLQESEAGRYLLYAYFSSATPIAMARVFQAYGCGYAMITDMNALEHTYLALYRVADGGLVVDHLLAAMAVLDKESDGLILPRFLGFADNRDFFYVVRRSPPEPAAVEEIFSAADQGAPRSSSVALGGLGG